MCVAPARASSYRSVAASVHTQLTELDVHGRYLMPDKYDGPRREVVADLLRTARQHTAPGDGPFAHRGLTPDGFSLAHDVADLIPARIHPYDQQPLDAGAWIDRALRVLAAAASGDTWRAQPCADLDFADRELKPFLENIITA